MADAGLVPVSASATPRNINPWLCWSTLYIWIRTIRQPISFWPLPKFLRT